MLTKTYKFHAYDSLSGLDDSGKKDPRLQDINDDTTNACSLLNGAARGDLIMLQRMIARGVDVDVADYDDRSSLHLAASNGHYYAVKYLILQGCNLTPIDRIGNTPLQDAQREGHERIAKYLREQADEKPRHSSNNPNDIQDEDNEDSIENGHSSDSAPCNRLHTIKSDQEALYESMNALAFSGNDQKYNNNTENDDNVHHSFADECSRSVKDLTIILELNGIRLTDTQIDTTIQKLRGEQFYDSMSRSSSRSERTNSPTGNLKSPRVLSISSTDGHGEKTTMTISPRHRNAMKRHLGLETKTPKTPEDNTRKGGGKKRRQSSTPASILKAMSKAHVIDGSCTLSLGDFNQACKDSPIIPKILRGEIAIPDWKYFCDDVVDMYNIASADKSGETAQYIPQLARVNPEQFGVSICTVSGQRFSHGDCTKDFCIQSCSKPLTYCIASELVGSANVHRHVGREPSGRNFNELSLADNNLPHNPLINAGAIMTCSLIKHKKSQADRFDYINSVWQKLAGGKRPGFSNATYLSERATADRNFCLGYLMKENHAFPDYINNAPELVKTLEFYFMCCSIELDCEAMSVVAGTLANGGVCPVTRERVFSAKTVRNCLSLIASCGMYDYSGEFGFLMGFPSKSGVAGALLVIIPGVMGFCTWSPRLDKIGNSVRGIAFCKLLGQRYNVHHFDGLNGQIQNKYDLTKSGGSNFDALLSTLTYAASQGDLKTIKLLHSLGMDLGASDYDDRTPLHVAAVEGQYRVCRYLISQGKVNPSPKDRWGGTPLSDAENAQHSKTASLLAQHGATRGRSNTKHTPRKCTSGLLETFAEGSEEEEDDEDY